MHKVLYRSDPSNAPQVKTSISPVSESSGAEKSPNIISHEYVDKLGETTNNLIFGYLDNKKGTKFTREQIRMAIVEHVNSQNEEGREQQHIARIQTGKAAVNYWIDMLVTNGSFKKQHSKPVLFWRSW
jgi:hypothetical protein